MDSEKINVLVVEPEKKPYMKEISSELSSLQHEVGGYIQAVYPYQVLLDSSFIAPGDVRKLCGKRRFTLAHECAHQLLFHLESEDTKAACRKLYAERRTYSLRDLKSNEDWNEWQANVLGAAILMPQEEVELAMWRFASMNPIQNFEGWLLQRDKMIVNMMCETFGVSKAALLIRLRHLRYNGP